MWFKVEQKRSSIAQKYIVRCNSDIGGSRVVEERSVKGVAVARKTAEMLATSLNVTTTVYGTDSEGEFVYGVHEVADGAGNAASPLIKRLFVESAAGSLNFKDQLITNIPEETIKGFAAMSAALGYIVREHKQAKRTTTPQISYSTLFRVFCGEGEPATISLAFRGTVPETGAQFVMVIQQLQQNGRSVGNSVGSIGLVYREQDESAVIALMRRLLKESNPFKDRVVLVNRDLRTVRSRMSDRSWSDLIPHEQVRAELDFIAASIRNREMLKAEGLTIKRGLLLAGPPGDGKSAAIECFVNGIAGEATIIIVEAVEHIRAVYHLAQTLAPAVVILEDLDLMTKSRQNPYSYGAISQNDVTGELLQVLSGGSAYADIVTIATTNHPEAIDEALAKRAGRFDAHVRMGYPSDADKERILYLYLDRFEVNDDFTRRRLQQTLTRDLGRLHLVPAHIEEFVKAGIKRARLAQRTPEYLDFEPGIEATKSIATAKQS
jgi:AAA+ superfamily predicted ATPase